jgi:hypothetical protein
MIETWAHGETQELSLKGNSCCGLKVSRTTVSKTTPNVKAFIDC